MINKERISEPFVKENIIKWLRTRGWKISPITYSKFGVDIKASRNGDQYLIECKGETSSPNIDFLTCVGQILSRMTHQSQSTTNYYAIGLPNTERYRELSKKLIPKSIRKKLKLRIIFVDREGKVIEIRPLKDL